MMEKVRNYLDQKIQQGRNEIPGLLVIVVNDPRDGKVTPSVNPPKTHFTVLLWVNLGPVRGPVSVWLGSSSQFPLSFLIHLSKEPF